MDTKIKIFDCLLWECRRGKKNWCCSCLLSGSSLNKPCIPVLYFLAKRGAKSPSRKRIYNLVASARSARARVVLRLANLRAPFFMNLCIFWCLPNVAQCVSKQHCIELCHRWLGRTIMPVKQCLRSVNHDKFPMQMTQKSKHSNAGFTKWLEILAVEDFPPKLLRSENSDLKFRVNS